VLSSAFVAARDGHLEDLKRCVDDGWCASCVDSHGSTALMWAAGGGHLHICKYLVDTCSVSVKDSGMSPGMSPGVSKKQRKRLRTPLHWAARHGHLEVCRCATASLFLSAAEWEPHCLCCGPGYCFSMDCLASPLVSSGHLCSEARFGMQVAGA
jgi:ankyrin repeat protein